MTVVIPQPQPDANKGGRPRGSRGNGKTMNEMIEREKRKLARIEMETRATEARAAAEDIARITELRAQQRERAAELYIK